MTNLYRVTPEVSTLLGDPKFVVYLVLPSKHDIRLDILVRAEQSMPHLEYHRVYTLREMCGAEWWDTLPKSDRIEGGKAFAFLVAQGGFQLEFACHPERSNKIYRRV